MMHVTGLVCVVCGTTYPPDYEGYVCPDHGSDGILDVRYDYDAIGSTFTPASLAADPDRTMWRYRPLMPIGPRAAVPPLTVGGTPMYDAPRLAEQLRVELVRRGDRFRDRGGHFVFGRCGPDVRCQADRHQ